MQYPLSCLDGRAVMLPLAKYCLKNSVVHELAHNTNPEYKAKVHMKCNLTFTFRSAHLLYPTPTKRSGKTCQQFLFLYLTYDIWTNNFLRLSFIFVQLYTHRQKSFHNLLNKLHKQNIILARYNKLYLQLQHSKRYMDCTINHNVKKHIKVIRHLSYKNTDCIHNDTIPRK